MKIYKSTFDSNEYYCLIEYVFSVKKNWGIVVGAYNGLSSGKRYVYNKNQIRFDRLIQVDEIQFKENEKYLYEKMKNDLSIIELISRVLVDYKFVGEQQFNEKILYIPQIRDIIYGIINENKIEHKIDSGSILSYLNHFEDLNCYF